MPCRLRKPAGFSLVGTLVACALSGYLLTAVFQILLLWSRDWVAYRIQQAWHLQYQKIVAVLDQMVARSYLPCGPGIAGLDGDWIFHPDPLVGWSVRHYTHRYPYLSDPGANGSPTPVPWLDPHSRDQWVWTDCIQAAVWPADMPLAARQAWLQNAPFTPQYAVAFHWDHYAIRETRRQTADGRPIRSWFYRRDPDAPWEEWVASSIDRVNFKILNSRTLWCAIHPMVPVGWEKPLHLERIYYAYIFANSPRDGGVACDQRDPGGDGTVVLGFVRRPGMAFPSDPGSVFRRSDGTRKTGQ